MNSPRQAESADDICPRPDRPLPMSTTPLVTPLYQTAVYRCDDTDQADRLLEGIETGYVYARDRHPNADLLAEKIGALHGARRTVICGSGMAASSAIALTELKAGDHVVVGDQMYGRTLVLLRQLTRLGVSCTAVDACDPAAVSAALQPATRLVWVETITNPLVRVVDIARLAETTHRGGAKLVVDNTFASPALCRPLELGADYVYESLTKIMNGHSDVLLGAVCCGDAQAELAATVATFGLAAAPFDCWLATRGLSTLALRADRASSNALAAARFVATHAKCERTFYPGLPDHADHALARLQLDGRFGSIVSFTLTGGRAAADRFIAASQIPFCPSLGDLSTTLSHPESTSHRGLTAAERERLGIAGGTIRLSVGIESPEAIVAALEAGLNGV